MTLAEGIRNAVRRLEASWRLTRQTHEFHAEQDEIRHDLETLARVAEGQTEMRQ